jgi:hypothetical protein
MLITGEGSCQYSGNRMHAQLSWEGAMKTIADLTAFIANLMTISASGIAIYLFFWKGKYISSVFNTLLSYSTQITLSELNGKLNSLNDLRATEPEHKEEILNLLNDIAGQLRGHPTLKSKFSELIGEIGRITASKVKITEQKKRALVSELREQVRHVGILNIELVKGQ